MGRVGWVCGQLTIGLSGIQLMQCCSLDGQAVWKQLRAWVRLAAIRTPGEGGCWKEGAKEAETDKKINKINGA